MILNERVLQAVLALADELHFGRAAERLHVSQPALSGTVRTLENDLGVRLFRRTSRRVELTEAGSIFAAEARRLIAESRRVVTLVRNSAPEITGPLRIAYPASLDARWLGSLISEARQAPRLGSDIEFLSAQGADLLAGLLDRSLHAAFFAGRLCHADFECVTFFREPYAVAMSPGHRLAGLARLEFSGLAEEPAVWLRRDVDPLLFEGFLARCAERGYRPKIRQQAGTFQECLEFARAGLGITFLPAFLRPGAADRPAHFAAMPEGSLYAECSLAYGRNASSRELDRFIKLAQRQAAERRG